jgi:Na+-translocating ferredoxin:NAD+ oxidoreductase subunit C
MRTFKGGIHPEYKKENTSGKPIINSKEPSSVAILLSQGGAACEALVKVGDIVKAGQKLGDSDKLISAPVHASISGKVTAIENCPHPNGSIVKAVIIESDGKLEKTSPINDINVRETGLVGLGGGSFPTHVKLHPPADKHIDTVIINGAECEPYITCDHAQMLAEPDLVIEGAKLIMDFTKAKRAFIGIEDNKMDAYLSISSKLNDPNIKAVLLKTKYPQGGEKQLVNAVTGREVPSGKLPMDAGCIVSNVGTAIELARAIKTGTPITERVITITGAVKNPSNMRVKIGTRIKDIIDECGGFTGTPKKVILGGPMMGISQSTLDTPIAKCTTCILILNEQDVKYYEEGTCIRCCKCVDACPVQLTPNFLADYAQNDLHEKACDIGAMDCIECGLCSYVCPTRRELVHWIKLAKAKKVKK